MSHFDQGPVVKKLIGAVMQIGEPQRVIIVEPLELPVENPKRISESEPSTPQREPIEPEKVPVP